MNKRNLLLIGTNFEGTATIFEVEYINEMKKYFNLYSYGKNHKYNNENTNMKNIIRDLDIDIVMLHYNTNDIDRENFYKLKFDTKYMLLSDFHNYQLGKTKEQIEETLQIYNIKKVFAKAMCKDFLKIPQIIFSPWSFDEKYEFQPNNKKYDVCMFGSASGTYTFRKEIYKELNNFATENNLKLITGARPPEAKYDINFMNNYDEEKREKFKVGDEYIKTIQQCKIMITSTDKMYGYPVKKFFEGAMTGCLVLSDEPFLAKKLGFVDGETYVKINKDNWKEKVLYYLEHEDERNIIIKKARNNFLKKHTNQIRVKNLVDEMDENIKYTKSLMYKLINYTEGADLVMFLSGKDKKTILMPELSFSEYNISYINIASIHREVMGYMVLDIDDIVEEIIDILKGLKFRKLLLFGISKAGTFSLLLADRLSKVFDNKIKVLSFSPRLIAHDESIMQNKKDMLLDWSEKQEKNYKKYFNSIEVLNNCKFEADLIYTGMPLYKDHPEDEIEVAALCKKNKHFKKYFLNYAGLSNAHVTFFYFYGHEANLALLKKIIIKSLNNKSLDGWDNLIEKK